MTVRQLTLRMSERELGRWRRYAGTRGLPTERLQAQMAVLAYMVSSAFGGNAESLTDFMVGRSGPREQKRTTVQDGAAAFSAMSGRGVRVLGQKRKRKG